MKYTIQAYFEFEHKKQAEAYFKLLHDACETCKNAQFRHGRNLIDAFAYGWPEEESEVAT